MDILRKKKDPDISDFLAETEADTDEGITQLTPKQLAAREKRELEEAEYSGNESSDKETARVKRKKDSLVASAKNIKLWENVLDKYSQTNDINADEMRDLVKEFARSYLVPKSGSKDRVMNFYYSLVPKQTGEKPIADPKLLDLFYESQSYTVAPIQGADLIDLDTLEEKEYNGQESLEILREFLEQIADINKTVLRGKGMTRKKLDKLETLLGNKSEVDIDSLGNNIERLESTFRELLITLEKIKLEEERSLSKEDESESKEILDALRERLKDLKVTEQGKGTINEEDRNWQSPTDMVYDKVTDTLSDSKGTASIYDEGVFGTTTVFADVDTIIDKIEEIYSTIKEMSSLVPENSRHLKALKTMEKLINVTVKDYEFTVGKDRKRQIQIN